MTLVLTSSITVAFADSWKKPGKLSINNSSKALKVDQVQEQLKQRQNERDKQIKKYMERIEEKEKLKGKASNASSKGKKRIKELEGKIKQLERN